MGSALARVVFGISEPEVRLLANGTEPSKGTELTRKVAEKLRNDPSVVYGGYIEPDGLLAGEAPVVVTGGWTGNLLIMTAEAAFGQVTSALGDAARSNVLARVLCSSRASARTSLSWTAPLPRGGSGWGLRHALSSDTWPQMRPASPMRSVSLPDSSNPV